mgnify:CR=1 FL=1
MRNYKYNKKKLIKKNYKIKYKKKSIDVYWDREYNVGLDQNGNPLNSLKKRCNAYTEDEPETIEWIESFDSSSVFYDVGSNIGGFSFIATMIHDKIKVYSFEPNFINFYCMMKTCIQNKITNICPMNVAIHKKNKMDNFLYDHLEVGFKGNFGNELKSEMKNSAFSNPFKSGRGINSKSNVMGITIDSLVYDFGLPKPDYLKIDVDGNELFVIQGAIRLLKEKYIKQILIEIDDKVYQDSEVDNIIEECGYTPTKTIDIKQPKRNYKESVMRMVLYEST